MNVAGRRVLAIGQLFWQQWDDACNSIRAYRKKFSFLSTWDSVNLNLKFYFQIYSFSIVSIFMDCFGALDNLQFSRKHKFLTLIMFKKRDRTSNESDLRENLSCR